VAQYPLKRICILARIHGRVQGVAFRYHTQIEANRLGVHGWVRNLPDGTVEACIAGAEAQITLMKRWLQQGPSHASVEHVEFSLSTLAESWDRFSIRY